MTHNRENNIKDILILAAFTLVMTFGLTYCKAVLSQKDHYTQALEYAEKQDWKLALREYDLAMHMHVPLSPYTEKSASRLWEMGEMFEETGQDEWAHTAYTSIRSSLYSVRSFYLPGKHWIERTNDKIALLNVNILLKEGAIDMEHLDSEKDGFLYVQTVKQEPVLGYSLLAMLGLLGWIFATILTIFLGFDPSGKIRTKPLLLCSAGFSLGFSLWVWALLNA